MLIKYAKNKNGERIGVVVAIDRDRIGWSKCNFSMGDKFDKERGKYIALKRAEKYFYHPCKSGLLPHGSHERKYVNVRKISQSILSDFLEMVERAQHYFKRL